MEQKQKEMADSKALILHGFSKEQIFTIMRAIRREMGTEVDIAFAMTTPHSLTMQLGEIIKDVTEEHAYMKNNPPPTQPEK